MTRRITTGRGSVVCSECSSHDACSSTSAFSLSRSTTARRTVQTLIGSKVALRTSTRPAVTLPRGRCSAGRRGPDVALVAPSWPPWRARGSAAVGYGRAASRARRPGRSRATRTLLAVRAAAPSTASATARARRRGPRGRRRRCSARAAAGAAATRSASRFTPRNGELRQAAHEPAGRPVAGAPEDHRRLPRRRPARARRRRAPRAREPHEARRVAGVVLDAVAQDDAAVELRGRARCRAPPSAASASATRRAPPRPSTLAATHAAPAAAASRRKRAHCASACGCETTASIVARARRLARDQARGASARTCSPTIATSSVVERERVERRVDRALERVLDRHERRARPSPSCTATTRVVDRRRAGRARRRRRRGGAAQRLLA